MTNLKCPKGHDIHEIGKTIMDRYYNNYMQFHQYACYTCRRPYFEMDCIKEEVPSNPRQLLGNTEQLKNDQDGWIDFDKQQPEIGQEIEWKVAYWKSTSDQAQYNEYLEYALNKYSIKDKILWRPKELTIDEPEIDNQHEISCQSECDLCGHSYNVKTYDNGILETTLCDKCDWIDYQEKKPLNNEKIKAIVGEDVETEGTFFLSPHYGKGVLKLFDGSVTTLNIKKWKPYIDNHNLNKSECEHQFEKDIYSYPECLKCGILKIDAWPKSKPIKEQFPNINNHPKEMPMAELEDPTTWNKKCEHDWKLGYNFKNNITDEHIYCSKCFEDRLEKVKHDYKCEHLGLETPYIVFLCHKCFYSKHNRTNQPEQVEDLLLQASDAGYECGYQDAKDKYKHTCIDKIIEALIECRKWQSENPNKELRDYSVTLLNGLINKLKELKDKKC